MILDVSQALCFFKATAGGDKAQSVVQEGAAVSGAGK